MILRYSYITSISFTQRIEDHTFAMRCVPFADASQRVIEQCTSVIPQCDITSAADTFGNTILSGYIARRHNLFTYESSGLVDVRRVVEPEACNPMYHYPSPLTIPTSEMHEAVVTLGPVGDTETWIARLMSYLTKKISYRSGQTSITTTAADAWELGCGVCQDYAHVAIAMCRLAGIPARYACGLMTGEGATHAWVEYHDGIGWRGFDPTNNNFVNDNYIKMAHGRDFSDCSISRGSFRGCGTEQTTNVSVDVWHVKHYETTKNKWNKTTE